MGTGKRDSAVKRKSKFLAVGGDGDEARLEFIERLEKKGIKKLRKDPRWLVVTRGVMRASILYFQEPSQFGINGGKISKLSISKDKKQLVNFDRGWDVEPPESGPVRELFDDIMDCE